MKRLILRMLHYFIGHVWEGNGIDGNIIFHCPVCGKTCKDYSKFYKFTPQPGKD